MSVRLVQRLALTLGLATRLAMPQLGSMPLALDLDFPGISILEKCRQGPAFGFALDVPF